MYRISAFVVTGVADDVIRLARRAEIFSLIYVVAGRLFLAQ